MHLLRYSTGCLLLLISFVATANAGTPGSFRGTVVETDQGAQDGWIYVQGKNGGIRRVDISRASVSYSESIPAMQRNKSARADLAAGSEVRVTAEQQSDGEWRATRVEILKTAAPGGESRKLGSS